MSFSFTKVQNWAASFLQAIVAESLKVLKFSFIFGSKAAFFSASSATAPLIGFFGSRSSATLVFALRSIIHAISFGVSATTLFYHVPTFFSTLYLSEKSTLAKILIPLACIALFVAHPVGMQTSWYTIYWMLPIAVAAFSIDSIFLKSLASSLVSHAVGTVIWLYAGLLSVETIHTIATIAWLERLLFALTLTSAYYGVVYAQQLYTYIRKEIASNVSMEQA